MADLPISSLPPIAGSDVQPSQDQLALADVSASETKKVTPTGVVSAALTKTPANGGLPNGSILADKINWDSATDGSIPGDKVDLSGVVLGENTVNTEQLVDGSVTGDKIADGSIKVNHLDPTVVDPDGGLQLTVDGLGIENAVTPGTFAGISYDEHGLITDVAADGLVPRTDLPVATETELGAVIIPTDGGLSVTGTGEVSHSNVILNGAFAGIAYDEHGHITSVDPTGQIPPNSIPIAGTTSSEIGGIYVPTGGDLEVGTDGALTHVSNTVPGEYTKVNVDSAGHVTSGSNLDPSDIPEVSADKITGEIETDQLAECSVTAPKICDYATCLMQEDNPGAGDFLGQFWYTPSTAQLRVYARGSGPESIWLPVGFGALQANNLRWGGTYDADTDTVVSLTSIGVSEGLTAGQSFPIASDQLSGIYFVCQVAGNNCSQSALDGINHTAGDWALCLDEAQGWVHIDANAGGGGGGGGAQYLNDLLDVEIGGASSPFSTAPAVALSRDHLLRYDGGAGLWRNTDIIDGGSID